MYSKLYSYNLLIFPENLTRISILFLYIIFEICNKNSKKLNALEFFSNILQIEERTLGNFGVCPLFDGVHFSEGKIFKYVCGVDIKRCPLVGSASCACFTVLCCFTCLFMSNFKNVFFFFWMCNVKHINLSKT